MIRKQRVEIESLQTKLDLTTSQLHDMETALTHSAQNLNKVPDQLVIIIITIITLSV